MESLPLGYLNERNGRQFGDTVGIVIRYTRRDATSMRLKVMVDISKPLKAGFFLDREGRSSLWIQCKYEKLGRFCFKCGILGHEQDECRKQKWALVEAFSDGLYVWRLALH